MAGQLAAKIAELGATAHWGLGEAAGDALDAIGSNDGTVTIGAGVRDVAALNDQGDGCITFDGADTTCAVADADAIRNIFDGGGSFFFMFNANSDGEGSFGRVWQKAHRFVVSSESGGNVRLRMIVNWSGNNHDFQTAVDIPINTTIIGVWVYDADTIGNLPTLYVHDGTSITTRTSGSGLTRNGAEETGTRSTDSGSSFRIGSGSGSTNVFDGELDEIAVFGGVTLTEAQATALIDLALQEVGESLFMMSRAG